MDNIREGNKLIAEFDGVYKHYSPVDKSVFTDQTWLDYISDNLEMKYHNSWDWLMPVLEKIQSIDITPPPNYTGYRIEIVVQGYVKITGSGMPEIFTNVSVEGGLINAVYKAVIKFLQWYNQQSIKQP